LKAVFKKVGAYRDGVITEKDWRRYAVENRESLRQTFGSKSVADITAAFEVNDEDDDGNGELTWEEFREAAKGAIMLQKRPEDDFVKPPPVFTEADLAALFDSVDKDGDGLINETDWFKKLSYAKDSLEEQFGEAALKEMGKIFVKRMNTDQLGNLVLTLADFMAEASKLAKQLPPPVSRGSRRSRIPEKSESLEEGLFRSRNTASRNRSMRMEEGLGLGTPGSGQSPAEDVERRRSSDPVQDKARRTQLLMMS
jgi:Ca2+-binding EF-hand superfamily protein